MPHPPRGFDCAAFEKIDNKQSFRLFNQKGEDLEKYTEKNTTALLDGLGIDVCIFLQYNIYTGGNGEHTRDCTSDLP